MLSFYGMHNKKANILYRSLSSKRRTIICITQNCVHLCSCDETRKLIFSEIQINKLVSFDFGSNWVPAENLATAIEQLDPKVNENQWKKLIGTFHSNCAKVNCTQTDEWNNGEEKTTKSPCLRQRYLLPTRNVVNVRWRGN